MELKPLAIDTFGPAPDLQSLADRVRRQPALARDLQVLELVRAVAGRWRETTDMMQASEEVPLAAWIVRRKIEGLIRPDDPPQETMEFNPSLRPLWIDEAMTTLQHSAQKAAGSWPHPAEYTPRPPAAVKDPSLWKLAWSYPVLRSKKSPPPTVVSRGAEPLGDRMASLLTLFPANAPRISFTEHFRHVSRSELVDHFLAAVHLWHEQRIALDQKKSFGPIWMEIVPRDGSLHGSRR